MSSKSNEYGYVPESLTQSRNNNTGVFEIDDINSLITEQKWTGKSYGQIELIETKNMTGVASLTFTNLGSYNHHLIVIHYWAPSTSGIEGLAMRLSNNGGTSYLQTADYDICHAYGTTSGTNSSTQSTSSTSIATGPYINDEGIAASKIYLHNALDSTRVTHASYHHADYRGDGGYAGQTVFSFGSNYWPTAETHNAIQLFCTNNAATGLISLYGIGEVA